MTALRRLLASEPALVSGGAQAAVALVVALGLHLSAGQAGAIEAAAAALGALVVATAVTPVPPAAFTGLVTAAGTLLAAFGLPHPSAALVSTLSATLAAVLASLLRGHVTPAKAAK